VEQQNKLIMLHEYHARFLNSLYPKHVVDAMNRKNMNCLSRYHHDITICFADIKGFTSLCCNMKPSTVMGFMNVLFGEFDKLLNKYNIYKLETVGDCYVTVSGLINHKPNGERVVELMDTAIAVGNMFGFAKDMIRAAYKLYLPGTYCRHVELRVGIHTGDVTSGIIDNTMPKFSLFGDTMNMASRMETTGKPMQIHLSSNTFNLLDDENKEMCKEQKIFVKGKGNTCTYLMNCRQDKQYHYQK
jgi:ubiquitin carboxyl-terminal hydrolase 48